MASGEEFEADIQIMLSDLDSLGGYQFRVRYDLDELTLLSKDQFPPTNFEVSDNDNNRSDTDETQFGIGTSYMETQVGRY